MSWPNICYAVLDRGMGMVDMWIAGHISDTPDPIAAIGLSQQILFIIIILSIAITVGTMPIIGQHFGAGEMENVKYSSFQALKGMAICGAFLSPLLFFMAAPMFRLMRAEQPVIEYGLNYLQPLSLGLVFMFLNYTMVILFRSVGRVKAPLFVLLIMHMVNIPVSIILSRGIEGVIPAQGMSGIAYGTLAGRATGAILLIALWIWLMRQYKSAKGPFLDKDFFKKVVSIGLPVAFMNFARSGAQIVFFSIFAAIGSMALASTAMTYQIRMVLLMSTLMIHQALIALVSHSIGEGDMEKAKRYVWQTQIWANLLMGSVAIIIMFFAGDIVSVICSMNQTESSELLVSTSTKMITIALLAQFFITVAIVFAAALTAGGDVKLPFIATCISEWLIMLPLAFLLAKKFPDQPHLIWIAFLVAPIFLAITYTLRFRQNKWQKRLI